MLRLLTAALLVAALASAPSAEGRVVHPLITRVDGRRLAGPGATGRRLTSVDACLATCEQVHYTKLCTTLTKLPGVTTPEALLEASVRMAASKAKMAETKLTKLAKSPKATGAMAASLQSCLESYQSLVDSLSSTQKMLKSGDSHSNVISELSAAGTFATDCDDVFEERPELDEPITGTQRHVSRLVSNSLDIAATVQHDKH